MFWKLLALPLVLMLVVLLIVLLGFGTFAEREHRHFDILRQQQLELLELRLEEAFAKAERRVDAQRDRYVQAHRWAEQQLSQGQSDLVQLSRELATQLQMQVDIYLVSADLVIYESTFEPDLGLDFKAPMFEDAQAAFRRVDLSPQVDLGSITREIVSGDFKIYTLSRLPDGNYLELGFVDPQLATIYEQAEREMLAISSVESVSLFLDLNGTLLSPLTDSALNRPAAVREKGDIAEFLREQLKPEREFFRQVQERASLPVVDQERSGKLTFYVELARTEVSEDVEHRYLARVHSSIQSVSPFEQYIPQMVLVVFLMLICLVFWLLYVIRYSVISPMQQIRAAIEQHVAVKLPSSTRIPKEIHFIAQSFNSYLQQSSELNGELRRQATIDPLTGLSNRGELNSSFEELKRMFTREQLWMGVAFIDLDRFKDYNDLYGHDAGDSALRAFSQVMRSCFQRPTDRIIRYGGEEFVVLFGCDSEQHAVELAESARERFEQAQIEHSGNPPYGVLTLSCGLVVFEAFRDVSVEEMLRLADKQLYTSKSADRNVLNFSSVTAV
ncbi:MAG TPA: GGDEF domain-containing protein [Marinobacterium sp.]|nr:GGDEF domain-containing protein [Marinobacterium sp.]